MRAAGEHPPPSVRSSHWPNNMLDANECIRTGLLLSFGFLLIFTAYNATEVLETSIIPSHCEGCVSGPATGMCQWEGVCQEKTQFSCDVVCAAPFNECKSRLGNVVLGTNYFTFMAASIAGPLIPYHFGEKWTMAGSSIFYGFFALANLVVASNPTDVPLQWGVMMPMSVISGTSAAFLWICQASYLTHLSVIYSKLNGMPKVASVGYFNGLFFSIYRVSSITGNAISSIVLGYLAWSTSTLFVIYATISFLGASLLFFVPTLPPLVAEEELELLKEHQPIIVPDMPQSTMQALFSLALDRRMLLLAPAMILNGIQQGFMTGEFTSNIIRESLGSPSIGTVFVLVGFTAVYSSYAFGKLADRYGPLWGQLVCFAVLLGAYILSYLAPAHWHGRCIVFDLSQWYEAFCLQLLCFIHHLLVVVLGQEFPTDSVNAFSIFRVYHAGGSSFSFLFFPSLSFHGRLIFLIASVVVSAVTFLWYYLRYRAVAQH
ncbi:hypothetical protein Ae201684P_022145 [Aphanomyces euteiches]|nr:hypothetical protein Ae201684P_022145 [Aphanomyces euteiches]